MASVKIDSELMTNYVPAIPVPAGSHFVTCLDPQSRRPMVFGISTDPKSKLVLIKEDELGVPQLIDFGAKLGISSDLIVQAFDCQQSNDLTVYLCVAASTADGTMSNVFVVRPFQMTQSPIVNVMPIHATDTVNKVYLGPADGQHGYPTILLVHKSATILNSKDITRLLVDPRMQSWTALRDMELPTNVNDIVDIALAANAYGRGLYALCKVSDTESRVIGEFVRYDTDQNDGSLFWYNVQLDNAPSNVKSIATFTDTYGRSSLLLSNADGLFYMTCKQATRRSGTASPLISASRSAIFKSSPELQSCQDKNQITIWSRGSDGSLGYATLDISQPNQMAKPDLTMLKPSGVTGFSASVSVPDRGAVSQTLVTVDGSNNLAIMSQSLDSRLWKTQPFYSASKVKNVAFSSYTVNLQAVDARTQAVPNGTIVVSASSQSSALVNGSWTTLTTSPTPYTLDYNGEIAFILSAESLATPKLTLSKLANSKGQDQGMQERMIDPTLKVMDKMAILADPNKWGDVKDDKGNALFTGSKMPSSDVVKSAASAFDGFNQASKALRNPGTVVKASADDAISDAWHFVKKTASDAKDWVCKQIDGAWHFVCTLYGEVRKFVLDTMEKVAEGITWVLNKIQVVWEDVKNYFGWLFAWDDILATKNTITVIFNTFLEYSHDSVERATPAVDDFFNGLKRQVNGGGSSDLQSADSKSVDSSSGSDLLSSTKMKWVSERIKNGNAVEGSQITQTSDHSKDSDMQSAAEQTKPFTNVAKGLMDAPSNLISHDFLDKGLHTAMNTLRNLAVSAISEMIDGLNTAIKGLLSMFAKLITVIKDIGNYPLDIPIFSDLYKTFIDKDCNLFNILAFLIAIPATILIKAITKKAPPSLKSFSTGTFAFLFEVNARSLMASVLPTPAPQQSAPSDSQASFMMVEAPDVQMKSMAVQNKSLQSQAPAAQAPAPTPEDLDQASTAMAKLYKDENFSDDDKRVILKIKNTVPGLSSVNDSDFLAELNSIARIVPTLVNGIITGVTFILPFLTIGDMIDLSKDLELDPDEGFEALGRCATIFFNLLGGAAAMITPTPGYPGALPRRISAALTFPFGCIQCIWIAMSGMLVKPGSPEDSFRESQLILKTTQFMTMCGAYDQEIKAGWNDGVNDMDCSAFGVNAITYGIISDMCELVAYELGKQPEAKEFQLLAIAGQALAGFYNGIFASCRYTRQVAMGYLPMYSSP